MFVNFLKIIRYPKVLIKFLYDTTFYFLFSFITILIMIITSLLISNTEISIVLKDNNITSSLIGAIPCYLIAMYYSIDTNHHFIRKITLFFVICTIALFNIVSNINITNKDLLLTLIYGSLAFSFGISFFYKDYKDTFFKEITKLKEEDKIVEEVTNKEISSNTPYSNYKV